MFLLMLVALTYFYHNLVEYLLLSFKMWINFHRFLLLAKMWAKIPVMENLLGWQWYHVCFLTHENILAIIFHGFKSNMQQEDNFWYYHYDKNVKYFHLQWIMVHWNLPVLPNAKLRGTRLNVISISLIFYPVFIDPAGINWPAVEDYLPWSNLDRDGFKFQSLKDTESVNNYNSVNIFWRNAY